MIGEHMELAIKQMSADFVRRTFYKSSFAFSVCFAQEAKAGVCFSPRKIGVFGQTGVFEFSLSPLSAKGLSQMAE